MSKLDPTNRTIFAATLTSQLGCVRRADQLRSQKLVHRQCQPNNFLGPTPGLMVLHLQLSNKGKHNKFGRSDIMGYISHIDALRDPSAQNGMMLLYRFFSLGEMLPPFDSCQMYAVPTYPAMRNCGCISDKQYGRNWKAAMKECNVDNWKITSITRLQGYHEMNDAGVPNDHLGRIAGHAKTNRTKTSTSTHTKTVLPDQSAGQGDCASLRSGGIFKYLTQVVFPRFTADISRMLFF